MNAKEAFVLLGSNMGHREHALHQALTLLAGVLGQPAQISDMYASGSWGYNGQEYLNQLVVFTTTEHPLKLLHILLEIEKSMGRQRKPGSGYTDRVIDIDLLYLGNMVYNTPELILPHPRLHLRRFALLPLVHLAPEMVHPCLGKTHLELLSALEDEITVRLHTT